MTPVSPCTLFIRSFFAAGWQRLGCWQAVLFMAMGKLARYAVIAIVTA
jgi:membrane protein YqaA with SNARE-associated domain